MNVRDLAAGVVCVGFEGHGVSAQLRAQLQSVPLAGVVLFARNVLSVEQTRKLTDELRSCFQQDTPVLAMDQEGGRVARIRGGVVEIPSMMAVAATGSGAALARSAGEQTGADLRRVGINVDFAPVLDLALHGANTVIGTRAFSDVPEVVVEFGGAFAAGLQDAGIVPTFKHFPGHGATAVDSHLQLPVIDAEEATVRARDLAPFSALLPGAQAVMTAHIVVNAFDPHHPATNAMRLLTDVLRKEIGFGGVCFTDCMEMDAMAKSVGTARGAVLALKAGADCVLISHRFDLALQAIDQIENAVADGTLPLLRLQEAFERVQTLRATLTPPLAVDAPAPHPGIGVEIGREAVTHIRGDVHANAAQSIVVSFEGTTTEGVQGTHAQHASVRRFAPDLEEYLVPLEPEPADVELLLQRLRDRNKRAILLVRRAHVYEMQAAAIARILNEFPDALLISTREPFDIDIFPQARNVLATFGDDAPSLAGLAAVLFEGAAPHGRFPVRWAAAAYAFPATDRAISAHAGTQFTGAVARVQVRGEPVFERAYGVTRNDAEAREVFRDTRFDLASITKIFVATRALELVQRGVLALDSPLLPWLTEWEGTAHAAITLRMLLAHTSGMNSGADYRQLLDFNVAHFALQRELVAVPGEGVIYSDLGFIALGVLLERAESRSLGGSIGGYIPNPRSWKTIPATEDDGWRGRVQGFVHDEKAFLMGGVAGHAGIFGTASDVAALAERYLGALHGRASSLDAQLASEAVREQAYDPVLRRGLGWALKTSDENSCGRWFSRETFGHTGFVGTCVWADPVRDVSAVLLTNSVYFGRNDTRNLRAGFYEAVIDDLGMR